MSDDDAAREAAPGAGPTPDPPADPPEDETRRRFRAALERKQGHAAGGSRPHDPAGTVTPRSNDKHQRTFRRKSGG